MRNKKIGIIDYKDINIKVSPVEIVEVNQVPSDAKIVNYTWLYVNKDGTPDKRYKDNPSISHLFIWKYLYNIHQWYLNVTFTVFQF